MTTRIAILDDYQGVALASADWAAVHRNAEVVVFREHIAEEDQLAAALADIDAVVVMRERTPIRSTLLERLPSLKLIVTTGPVNASIDVEAAGRLGITVCGTGGILTPTAELTWALILAVTRGVVSQDRALREGRWQTMVGLDLQGRRLGVLGLGRLGGQVARIGVAFGMDVVAWSQNLTAERAREIGVARVDKGELFETSDVLTIHLQLSERTRGLVGRHELAVMKSTAYLVNTSRGPIVDEGALVDALTGGRLAGAGLDVFDVEPLPKDHPLMRLENTVLTPHIGYVSRASYERFYEGIVENVLAWMSGHPVNLPLTT